MNAAQLIRALAEAAYLARHGDFVTSSAPYALRIASASGVTLPEAAQTQEIAREHHAPPAETRAQPSPPQAPLPA